MVDTIPVVELEMACFIIAVVEHMESFVYFIVELLYAVWRYDGTICLRAVVCWHKECVVLSGFPRDISFSCTCDGRVTFLYTIDL